MALDLNQLKPKNLDMPSSPKPAVGILKMEIRFSAAKIGLDQRMVFTERLLLLLQTGVSLHEALKAMQQQTEEPSVANIIHSLAETISNGESLSVALAACRTFL